MFGQNISNMNINYMYLVVVGINEALFEAVEQQKWDKKTKLLVPRQLANVVPHHLKRNILMTLGSFTIVNIFFNS